MTLQGHKLRERRNIQVLMLRYRAIDQWWWLHTGWFGLRAQSETFSESPAETKKGLHQNNSIRRRRKRTLHYNDLGTWVLFGYLLSRRYFVHHVVMYGSSVTPEQPLCCGPVSITSSVWPQRQGCHTLHPSPPYTIYHNTEQSSVVQCKGVRHCLNAV